MDIRKTGYGYENPPNPENSCDDEFADSGIARPRRGAK